SRSSRSALMKVSSLREFLRSLGATLATVGVMPKSLTDLGSVSDALEPFADLDVEQLADFLRRAEEYRRAGTVPLVAEAPGVEEIGAHARQLDEVVAGYETAGPDQAAEVENRIARHRDELQQSLTQLASRFGSKVTFKLDAKWLNQLRARAEANRASAQA